MPAAAYSCAGFASVLVPPSPKSQVRSVINPVEASAKPRTTGAQPAVPSTVKAATGALAPTVTWSTRVSVSGPQSFSAINRTV